MQVEILDLVLGNAPFVIEEIDGLGAADIRTSSFLYSGRDGGDMPEQNYGFRDISISGTILGDTCDHNQQLRKSYFDNLPIRTLLPVYITTFNGERFLTYCKVIKPNCKYLKGGKDSEFLLQLRSGDPLFYSTEGGDLQTAIVERTNDSGGYVTPYVLPVVWEAGGQPTVVLNSGNATAYPIIIIHDTTHDPIITNQATGEQFAMSINTNDGDELVIDMLNRTVKLNGSDVIGNKVDGSVWWGLLEGNNPIRFDTDTALDNGYAELTWRNGVTGI